MLSEQAVYILDQNQDEISTLLLGESAVQRSYEEKIRKFFVGSNYLLNLNRTMIDNRRNSQSSPRPATTLCGDRVHGGGAKGQDEEAPRATGRSLRLPPATCLPRRSVNPSRCRFPKTLSFCSRSFSMWPKVPLLLSGKFTGDPRASCFHARHALERLVMRVYKVDNTLTPPTVNNLDAYLHDSSFLKLIPEVVWQKAEYVRQAGNLAVHGKKIPSLKRLWMSYGNFPMCSTGQVVLISAKERKICVEKSMTNQ